jgi:hypothetical protein
MDCSRNIIHNLLHNHILHKQERTMNKYDFHIPFLHSMVIIAAVTLVAMASSRYFVERYYYNTIKTPIFTTQNSNFHPAP